MKEINARDFPEYLKGLETSGNPFNCPHLRVLSEDIIIKGTEKGEFGDGEEYRRREPMCMDGGLNLYRCRFDNRHPLIVNDEGELEIECMAHRNLFKLKVENFEERD